jgi:hypothetical protein
MPGPEEFPWDYRVRCAFCGENYPAATPDSDHPLLRAHILQCGKHPLHAILRQRDLLRSAVKRLCEEAESGRRISARRLVRLRRLLDETAVP